MTIVRSCGCGCDFMRAVCRRNWGLMVIISGDWSWLVMLIEIAWRGSRDRFNMMIVAWWGSWSRFKVMIVAWWRGGGGFMVMVVVARRGGRDRCGFMMAIVIRRRRCWGRLMMMIACRCRCNNLVRLGWFVGWRRRMTVTGC